MNQQSCVSWWQDRTHISSSLRITTETPFSMFEAKGSTQHAPFTEGKWGLQHSSLQTDCHHNVLKHLSVLSLYSWICWSLQKNVTDSSGLSFVNQHSVRGALSHTLTLVSLYLSGRISFWILAPRLTVTSSSKTWLRIRITSKDF